MRDRVWASNVFMGVSTLPGSERTVTARVAGERLVVEERYPVASSQGVTAMAASHTFRLSEDGETMTYTLRRATRTSGPPVTYVLKRQGFHEAYVMQLEDNWEIDGKLPLQAFLVSLQGLANTDSARLYFLYPPGWPFPIP